MHNDCLTINQFIVIFPKCNNNKNCEWVAKYFCTWCAKYYFLLIWRPIMHTHKSKDSFCNLLIFRSLSKLFLKAFVLWVNTAIYLRSNDYSIIILLIRRIDEVIFSKLVFQLNLTLVSDVRQSVLRVWIFF